MADKEPKTKARANGVLNKMTSDDLPLDEQEYRKRAQSNIKKMKGRIKKIVKGFKV